jgi:DNA modification methylase
MTYQRKEVIGSATLYLGDAREVAASLAAGSVHCIVTSPPFWRLRVYGAPGEIGLEQTPGAYARSVANAIDAARTSLAAGATAWVELGDSAACGGNGGGGSLVAKRRQWTGAHERKGWRSPPPGYQDRDLTHAPLLVAQQMRRRKWRHRQTIIWNKVRAGEPPRLDRPSSSHSYIYLFAAGKASNVRHPGEAWFESSVWSIAPQNTNKDHPAAITPEVARRCIAAGTREGGTVLDMFAGSATVGAVALAAGRRFIGVEANPAHFENACRQIAEAQRQATLFTGAAA